MSTIAVDMDGVIADWDSHFDYQLDLVGEPAARILRQAARTSFNLHEGHTPEEIEIIAALMDLPGFYADLQPIPGSIEALHEMVEAGHDVFIASSPWLTNSTCASDKFDWMERHVGPGWGDLSVLTKDKTRVMADYLIDDKPEITGRATPVWEHILFDRPNNRHIAGKRRMTDWSQWREFVALAAEAVSA